MKLEEQQKGAFLGRKRGNALTRLVNSLANLRVEFVDKNKPAEVLVSDSNTVIKLPQSGGGLPDGTVEREFDVVDPDTGQPTTFIFYGREP